MELDIENQVVLYNNNTVVSICGSNIKFIDKTEINDQNLAYELSDFWKKEIEKNCIHAPKVDLTLEDCIDIAVSIYEGTYVSMSDALNAIYKIKHLDGDKFIYSNYDPRDHDWYNSRYKACIFMQDPTVFGTFISVLRDNGYIDHITSRTIHFKNLETTLKGEEKIKTTQALKVIDEIGNKIKVTDRELLKKLQETGVVSYKYFINWHKNKLFPKATVDKLKRIGWTKFYEVNKGNNPYYRY